MLGIATRTASQPAQRKMIHLSAIELLKRLAAGDMTSRELTQAYLDRIARHDAAIGAFLRVDAARALAQADSVDCRRRAGKPLGSLAGLPVAVKDVLCTEGERTTCASRMLEQFRPPYDATVVAKLKAADAVLIGRTNMDEFAMGGSNENSAFRPVHNPWDLARVPGGSSGGSAAAVSARMTPLAIGSDTGGSIRSPAALCGITGLKPTYGRVSRYGLVAFASSLDQVGPMGQSAEDCALLLEVLAGHDPKDSTSVDTPAPRYSETIRQPLECLRLGLVREHFGDGLNPEVEAAAREAVRVYESLGATVVDLSLPHSKYAVATYYIIAPCEASSNLARYDGVHFGYRAGQGAEVSDQGAEIRGADSSNSPASDSPLVRMYRDSRSDGFGAEVKRRIMLGTYALSAGYYDAYYKKALQVRRLIRQDFDRAFEQVDLIVGPVTPTPAFKLGERTDDPLAMYLFDLYTVSTNLAGIAAMSIPCGVSSAGLPIGLHLQSPPFAEERLLRAAHMYQRATDWHKREPAMT
ncbi:MAG: Asp-tRNA(Asn)/Glu-tRNA(Gln) amidotransferase subunit GatA [Planctomycetaceae bacterium]|nr:Asp-tRNA(Asn)/Glu-tRNA(Gln) amidotransferase subunit GatA [Planctomycetaceae bacterium]